MNISQELGAAAAVTVAYGMLFGGVEWWSRRHPRTDVELTRKAVHLGGGLIALSFPWIFQSPMSVALLALPFVVLLIVARRRAMLGSVQGVQRKTIGEILYPLAISSTLLLAAAFDARVIYVVSILSLAVGDALAGVIGSRFGRRRYVVFGGVKSVEGSLAFGATTMAMTVVVLVISGEWTAGEAVIAAALAALVGTALEAATPNGFDNVTVPLGVAGALLLASGHT